MDKFLTASKIKSAGPREKEAFIEARCRDKSVLDLGCVRHSADFALNDPNWLHRKIKHVAREVIGVDYLPDEISTLNAAGYQIVFGDVTKPLEIDRKFDVIVAGDLIEHLTNFEGFFTNCRRLLAPSGILIITTPNPFYTDEFHFVAFKRNYLVNPEHTCWIDPQCLTQLSGRFGFALAELHFISQTWKLGGLICETKNHPFDIYKEIWGNDTRAFWLFRAIIARVFKIFYYPFRFITGGRSALVKYSDYLAVLKLESAQPSGLGEMAN